ncbi:MAG: sigma-70 family RNA polymerase sigma factor [Acidobacteriota bacterium]|nr:sigma-70 family RNA polymerase sigma factor [Acidobacteriota bacterium]MDQ3653262.1 sigma-70 family RNA polymerase sigma factor [Acidobacteriota bacterium]
MSSARENSSPTDVEMLHAVARGDETAFAALHDRYAHILFGLMLRILHSRVDAEDVLQEVFLQVWQRAANFDETRGRPFTWLVTLARSRAIDRLRSSNARDRVASEAAYDVMETVGDAGDEAMLAENRDVVRHALAAIPEDQRRTLHLAYFEGLTQTEIASQLGEPLGTVKTRMRSGMTKLRDLIGNRLKSAR